MTNPLISRKTKIVATLGPASCEPAVIEELIMSGVNVFRLNLSHGTQSEHSAVVTSIRAAAIKLNSAIGILFDLQGPRIRTGLLDGGSIILEPGTCLRIRPGNAVGDDSFISTTYEPLCQDVTPGDTVLLDDGRIKLTVADITASEIECTVERGGKLGEHKGINLPGVRLSAASLTDKDIDDTRFAVEQGADFIALSFTRRAADVKDLKSLLEDLEEPSLPVIAKIENSSAIENLEDIIEAADGVMVARGDLGVEITVEKVPPLQKRIIRLANAASRTVITATQMLDSMIKRPVPTRAEVSDIANAVFDGTDAVMLSAETATGEFPVKVVETMSRVLIEAEHAKVETEQDLYRRRNKRESKDKLHQAEAVTYAASAAAREVEATAIIVYTQSGASACMLSGLRPTMPIIAFTPIDSTKRRLALRWGVYPFTMEFGTHTDELICRGEAALLDYNLAEYGDSIVIVSGTKVGIKGATNMMKIDWIGSDECTLPVK